MPDLAGPPSQRAPVGVSVCMATYNGIEYLDEQISSILSEIGPNDEIVVVDDCSSDGTPEWLRAHGDARLRVHANPSNIGHVASFGRALAMARGTVVFLSDQDDVWEPGRVEAMRAALSGADVVATNFEEFGRGSRSRLPPLRSEDSGRGFRNVVAVFLGRRAYFGSAMALRRDFLAELLPIPSFMQAHDLWIALAGNSMGKVAHLEFASVRRRLHETNLTPASRRGLRSVAYTRVTFALGLVVLAARRCRRARRR